MPLLTIFQ